MKGSYSLRSSSSVLGQAIDSGADPDHSQSQRPLLPDFHYDNHAECIRIELLVAPLQTAPMRYKSQRETVLFLTTTFHKVQLILVFRIQPYIAMSSLVPPQGSITPTTDSPEEASSVDDDSVHPTQLLVEITGLFSWPSFTSEALLMRMVFRHQGKRAARESRAVQREILPPHKGGQLHEAIETHQVRQRWRVCCRLEG